MKNTPETLGLQNKFDTLAQQYRDLTNLVKEIKLDLKDRESEKDRIMAELKLLVDGGFKGDKFDAIMDHGRRTIGKVSEQGLEKLKTYDERLVKKNKGTLTITFFDKQKGWDLEKQLVHEGHFVDRVEPGLTTESLTQIETVLKDRPDLGRYRPDIMELLDIQAKEILKVYER